MNGFPDWNQVPSGKIPEGPAKQKRSAGLLLSGVLIGISLVAFVLPLAAYHVAQVASVLRVRTAVFLFLTVSFFLYLMGQITHLPMFVMAGTTGFLTSPLLAIVLLIRARSKSAWWALAVLALPVFFSLMSLLSVPQGLNVEQWLTSELAKIPANQSASVNKEQVLAQMRNAQVFQQLQKLFDLHSWQRLAWFLFSEGGALSVSIFGSLLGTVALIDFAFNQTERIRGVLDYVLQRASEFPPQLVQLLLRTRESLTSLLRGIGNEVGNAPSTSLISSHQRKPQPVRKEGAALQSLFARLLREPLPPGETDVLGYRFRLAVDPGWHFRSFAVPLWLSTPALAVLVYLATLWKGDDALGSWLPGRPLGPVLVWSALIALGVLTGLALQGALVLYARLRPMAAVVAVFAVLLLSSAFAGGALSLAALLAGLGLLDSAYDFRNCLAKNKNAM
ncbi:hypothetical protein EBU99_11105 [bacterium]|nr:hypothetical protein [bacterium]